MRRIVPSWFLAAAVFVSPSLGWAPVGGGQRPNVVLIITDDVGYGDLGSYGSVAT